MSDGLPLDRTVVAASSAVADAVADLRYQLVSGALRPGDPVIEEDVARRLGISRTPVREAIGRLVSERILTKADNRTAQVFRPSLEDLLEIYEIRLPLEIIAATRAAEAVDDELRGVLVDTFANFRDRPTADREWITKHEEFHLTLFAGSGRKLLLETITALRLRSEPYMQFALRVDSKFRRNSQVHHAAMIEAVADHNPRRMERLVRQHLGATTSAVTALLKEGLWVPSIGASAKSSPLASHPNGARRD